jgi:hypothetical protein
MQKLIVLFSFSFLSSLLTVQAQSARMGVVFESKDGVLRNTDQLNGKKYIQAWPISLKKGMGICFFMESSSFIPAIYFYSPGNRKYFGNSSTDRTKTTDKVKNIFIAPADSTFYVMLTSVNDGMTGTFHYGYYLLDSSQMRFSSNYSVCERLGYLLNHWLADWNLVPRTYKLESNDDDDESYFEYYTTTNTLVKNKTAMISGVYEELVYDNSFETLGKTGNESRGFFKKICDDIRSCLDKNAWTIETEGVLGEESPFDLVARNSVTTYFFAKGASRNQSQKSFKVIWSPPGANLMSKKYSSMYTVKLVLN